MASQFVGKISSLFHQPAHRRVLLVSDPHDDSNGAKADESPPPYNSSREAVVLDSKALPKLPFSQECLQICPHETLSSERLQRIAKLPNFEKPGKTIDALNGSLQQHFRGHFKRNGSNQDLNVCAILRNPQDKDPLLRVDGCGEILHKESDTGTGLILRFQWLFFLRKSKPPQQCNTVDKLRSYLAPANIWLCGHKQLVDPDILQLVFEILNPDGKLADPIDRYLAREVGVGCDQCNSDIKVVKVLKSSENNTRIPRCQVHVTRPLGKGESAEDPVWLAQCAA